MLSDKKTEIMKNGAKIKYSLIFYDYKLSNLEQALTVLVSSSNCKKAQLEHMYHIKRTQEKKHAKEEVKFKHVKKIPLKMRSNINFSLYVKGGLTKGHASNLFDFSLPLRIQRD